MNREGYIYKLCCDGIDEFYVGSSWDMKQRKIEHKSMCNNVNSDKHNLKVYKFIRENKGFENWKFEILETALFENKKLREIREQHYMDTLKSTLNDKRAHRTKEQRYAQNRQYLKSDKGKIVMEKYNNKDERKQYIKQYNKQYSEQDEVKQYHKDYKQTEKYKAQAKEYTKKQLANKFNCACGIETSKAHQKRHENTKQHIKYITINNINNIQNLHIHN
jgi:hypothetical protein